MRRVAVIAELMREAPERPWWGSEGGFYNGRPMGTTYQKDPILRLDSWPSAGVANVIMQGPDHLDWAVARIRRLEAVLKAARRGHANTGGEEPCLATVGCPESCDCGADAHNAAIDAVLKEDS